MSELETSHNSGTPAPCLRSQLFLWWRGEKGRGGEEVACSCAGDFTFGMDKEKEEGKKEEERGEKDWKGRDGQILCTPHIMYEPTPREEENRLPRTILKPQAAAQLLVNVYFMLC